MQKFILSLVAVLCALSLPGRFRAQTQSTGPVAPHLPRGTATDVGNAEIQSLVQKTASDRISDQAIRVVSIHGADRGTEDEPRILLDCGGQRRRVSEDNLTGMYR